MTTILEATDPRVAGLIAAERARQHDTLCLIPSENHASRRRARRERLGADDKYSEGYPGSATTRATRSIDGVETLAAERARALFGVEHANVQPLSGAPANLAVYAAFLEPGRHRARHVARRRRAPHARLGRVGHRPLVPRRPLRRAARHGRLDLDEVRELALRERPKLIWCGGTAIPRTIDFAGFAAIADEVGRRARRRRRAHRRPDRRRRAPLARRPRRRRLDHDAQDAARPARRDAPVARRPRHAPSTARSSPACRAARTTTRPPRSRSRCTRPRSRSSPTTPARSSPTRRRSRHALIERGYDLVSGGTDNHLLLVDLTAQGVGGRPAAEALERAGLVCNYNAVPFDPRPAARPVRHPARHARDDHPRPAPRAHARRGALDRRGRRGRAARGRGGAGAHPRRGRSSSRGRSRRRRRLKVNGGIEGWVRARRGGTSVVSTTVWVVETTFVARGALAPDPLPSRS